MSLQKCYEEALAHNENVPVADEDVEQAEETVKQGYGSIIPTVNASTQYYWQAEGAAPGTASFYPTYQPITAITATQPLLQGFREWKGLEKVKRLRDQKIHTKKNVELTVYKQVVAAYYNILYLEHDLANLEEEIKYLGDRIKELTRWRHIGRAQLTDVLTAQTNLSKEEVLAEADRQQLKTARDAFGLLTGLAVDTQLDDDASAEFAPKVTSLDSYLDRVKERPDVVSSKEAVQASLDQINVSKADHLPSLAATYNRYLLRPAALANVDWDFRLVLTIPIFAGGVTQSKVRQAYSQSRQAELTERLTTRTADQEVRSFYDNLVSDLKQIQMNKENVSLSEQTFKEEQRSFRLGLVTNLDVLNALTNYIEAKRMFDQNRFNLKSHYLSLNAAAVVNQ